MIKMFLMKSKPIHFVKNMFQKRAGVYHTKHPAQCGNSSVLPSIAWLCVRVFTASKG